MNIFNNKLNLNRSNLLVSKNIDDYFSNLITKPVTNIQKNTKSQYTFEKFYTDYIDQNLLLIIILIGSIIFLIFKYYNKTFTEEDLNTEHFDKIKDVNNINKIDNKTLLKKKKLDQQLKLVKKYKIELDNEKNKILNIIDELSSMNYEDSKKLNNKIHNELKNNNKISSINNKISQIDALIDNVSSNNYSIIEKKINEKNNYIDGIYIQPPYIN